MSSPDYCTFDGDSGSGVAPYRPGVDDVGGAAFENAARPPIPGQMPSAEDWNQISMLVTRACRMMPTLSFTVKFYSAGTPTVELVCANDGLSSGDLTVTYPGTGHTRVVWPVGSLPAKRISPKATANSASEVVATVTQTGNQVDVYTWSSGAVESEVTVVVDGE